MEVKLFEIRDRLTFIPTMAVKVSALDGYLVRRSGYMDTFVFLTQLQTGKCQYAHYKWGDSRTMVNAHKYILENWDTLKNEDVVDVEFILGEVDKPAVSEREDIFL